VASYETEREAMLKRFGRTLRELREAKFPSQEAFALAAKLDRSHIYRLETGQRAPELATLLILADALEVSIEGLVQGIEVPRERRKWAGTGRRTRQ
jgi:transcriptional regulator with XRE-family HTH domain